MKAGCLIPTPGKTVLIDGRTGKEFENLSLLETPIC
jgi:DNA-directed RNA polymerase beta subunit